MKKVRVGEHTEITHCQSVPLVDRFAVDVPDIGSIGASQTQVELIRKESLPRTSRHDKLGDIEGDRFENTLGRMWISIIF